MKRIWPLSLFIVLSCNNTDLTLHDLNFADYEREAIKANEVDTIYFMAKNPDVKMGYGDLIPTWGDGMKRLYNWKYEDVGFYVYDSLGRLVHERAIYNRQYSYDSTGVLNYIIFHDYDVIQKYSSTYHFNKDSMVIRQRWDVQGWHGDRPTYHHKSIFRFDSKGLLVYEFNDDNYNTGGRTTTIQRNYKYESEKLRSEEELVSVNDTLRLRKITHIFNRPSGKIDSTVSEIYHKDSSHYKFVTLYDSSGLKSKSIVKDSITILYRHTKRHDR